MAFKLKYNFNGPPDNHVLIKQRGNNATLTSVNPMPQQFYPSSNDSVFAMGRRAFVQTKGEPNGPNNTDNKVAGNVRGNFGTTFNQIPPHKRVGLAITAPMSFKSNDTTSRNIAIRRCRAGGCVAPKKKGANNSFKSGGGSIYTGTGNRQIFAP